MIFKYNWLIHKNLKDIAYDLLQPVWNQTMIFKYNLLERKIQANYSHTWKINVLMSIFCVCTCEFTFVLPILISAESPTAEVLKCNDGGLVWDEHTHLYVKRAVMLSLFWRPPRRIFLIWVNYLFVLLLLKLNDSNNFMSSVLLDHFCSPVFPNVFSLYSNRWASTTPSPTWFLHNIEY